MLKKIILAIFALILLACLAVGGIFFMEYSRSTKEGNAIEVEVPEGCSTKEIIALLKEKGVIRYQLPFYLKLYQSDYRGKLRYGIYELNDGMSLDEIIENLATGGAVKSGSVLTIPEGYTAEMIAERLEEMEIVTAEEFLNALKDAAKAVPYKDELPDEKDVYYQLQGYLFPDTYYLDEDMTASQVVSMLLAEFDNQFDQARRDRAKELGMTVNEVLIRASLLEKETELLQEYPIIAGVINNRLAQDMPLQFDSTVVYAMTEGKYGVERVLYKDLKVDSPYNTYKVKGLPVGPIGNPGLGAIDAVLNPAEHKYLFFQTDTKRKDGSNIYTETYEEHMAAFATTDKGDETKPAK